MVEFVVGQIVVNDSRNLSLLNQCIYLVLTFVLSQLFLMK
jgi:hypothetical protein